MTSGRGAGGATGHDTAHTAMGAAYDTARARRWNEEWTAWSHTLVWAVAGIFAMVCVGVAWVSIREHRERRRRKQLKKDQQRERSARKDRAATQRTKHGL
jgi:hypothetical protein